MAVPVDGPHEYLEGQTVKIPVEFRSPGSGGVLVDPSPESSIVVYVTPPGLPTLKYAFPTGPDGDVKKLATGEYYIFVPLTQSQTNIGNRWFYRAQAIGTYDNEDITWCEEYWFDVRDSEITPYLP
jgi:hypothetical protein